MNHQGLETEQSAGVHAARGSVREGLAALQNFETLLRSPRVGPRSIGKMVGELRGSCEPIAHALGTLIDDIALREPSEAVAFQLADCARSSMQQLGEALVRADRREFGAKARLALESDVRRVSGELGTLRALIELLDAATCARATELEARELLEASVNAIALSSGPRANSRVVEVLAAAPAHWFSVTADPRVAMQLLGIGIGLMAATGAPCVSVQPSVQQDRAVFELSATDRGDDAVACAAPSIIGPSAEVASVASRVVGATFSVHATGCALSLPLASTSASLLPAPRARA